MDLYSMEILENLAKYCLFARMFPNLLRFQIWTKVRKWDKDFQYTQKNNHPI